MMRASDDPTSSPANDSDKERTTSSKLKEVLLLTIVFLVVVSGIGFGFYAITKNNEIATMHLAATATATASTIQNKQGNYVQVAGGYSGIAHNTTFHSAAVIDLILQQSSKTISGVIVVHKPLGGSGPVHGVAGTDRSVQFTTGNIDFKGRVQQDGSLTGTYIVSSDGETGDWSVARL